MGFAVHLAEGTRQREQEQKKKAARSEIDVRRGIFMRWEPMLAEWLG